MYHAGTETSHERINICHQ